jgi:hypothetical protein
VLPEYAELQERLQKQDEPVMILPPANGSAGYQGGRPCPFFAMKYVSWVWRWAG